MTEYIERDALMVALCKEITGEGDYYNGTDDMQDQIRDMVSQFPAADVASVRHGRWLHRKNGVAYCSECKIDAVEDETNYCPNCGATMKLED